MSLSKALATLRFNSIDQSQRVKYKLYIELLEGESYRALLFVTFQLQAIDSDFTLDWQGGQLQEIKINGLKTDFKIENQQIKFLDHKVFSLGNNEIQISYENKYSTDGHGLHSFIDQDKFQYTYSQCEPHHASKMIPCLDQPDIKAHFKLIAQIPTQWLVISNEKQCELGDLTGIRELGFLKERENYKIIEFNETVPLSTYLFAILAGPYSEIKCPKQWQHRDIEMSIYCRSSLLQYVQKDAEEIFTMTRRGMEYYEQLFQCEYAFSKYDQIFCPEYSTGAMENAGAVTINDDYVFKEDVPAYQRSDRANTILHELSHMWFGDLVTMKWWDDLWLNESFAEFISHLCQSEANTMQGMNHWVDFYKRKIWGYVEDQMQTTHPIYCDIENTDQAENIFDGITYAKGAALLKQLYFMMGKQKFSNSMGKYFSKYKFKNSTLDDFFGVMAEGFEGDYLKEWQQDWILKAGLNCVSAYIKGGKAHFTQKATLNEHPTLRSHIFKVAVYNGEGQQVRILQVRLEKMGQCEIDVGEVDDNCHLLLNYNDESFVKTSYYGKEAEFFLKELGKVEPSLSRALILRSLWDQVRDGEISFKVYIDGVLGCIQQEKDDTVSQMVLSWCAGGIEFYSPRAIRGQLKDQLCEVALKMLGQTENKNKQLILKKYIARWAESQQMLNSIKIEDYGVENGWIILNNVFARSTISLEDKWSLFEKQAIKDGSDQVKNQRRFCEVLIAQDWQKYWDYFINYNKEESVALAAEAMRGFNHDIHAQELVFYEDKFFDALPSVFEQKGSEYGKQFYYSLYPINDNIKLYQEKCKKLLDQVKNDILIRLLKESIDMDTRRSKTYAFYN